MTGQPGVFLHSKRYELNSNGGGNGGGNGHKPVQLTGPKLAHAHRTASQKAAVAAQMVKEEVERTKPTIIPAAADIGANIPYVRCALKLTPETRERVAAGEITITEAAKANGLLAAWLASTPEERAAFGADVGVDAVWDAAIKPSLGGTTTPRRAQCSAGLFISSSGGRNENEKTNRRRGRHGAFSRPCVA